MGTESITATMLQQNKGSRQNMAHTVTELRRSVNFDVPCMMRIEHLLMCAALF